MAAMRRTASLPLAIFLLLSGFYLLTMSGHTYSPDEETMLAVTRSLLARGEVAVRAEEVGTVAALRPGRADGRYSPYGVLPSLLAMPLHVLGALMGGTEPAARDFASRFAVTAMNGLLTAATAALLAAWAMRLGATGTWAAGLGLLYGLASFAWPYARTFFSEPLAALLIMLAAERAHAAATSTRPARDLALSGLAGGLLLTTRLAAGIALPVLGLAVLAALWQQRLTPIPVEPGALHEPPSGTLMPRTAILKPESAIQDGVSHTAQASAFSALRLAGAWLLGLLPGLAILLWYNLARFGTPLASGYASEAGLFTTSLSEGLYGLLFSPGKSVLLYAPPLLLALPGTWLLWRRGQRGVVLLGWGLFLSHLLLYARWGVWEGGGVWGPRFLLPVVAPLLLLGAGVGIGASGVRQPGRRLAAFAAGLLVTTLLLFGLLGNLGGVLLNFSTYGVTPISADRVNSLTGSALVGHWRILGTRWAAYATPPPACRLGDGFFAGEAEDGVALPRRTGARAELYCNAPAARLRFSLDDRRPPEAPPSALRLSLNGRTLAEPPSGQLRRYQVLLPPDAAQLAIEAVPWNPLAVSFSPRDDELGPQLAALHGIPPDGAALVVADTAIAPLPLRPTPRWAWYYDPPNQHLADHWAWYLPRVELRGPRAWALAALIVLGGSAAMFSGARQLRRAIRA
jgi:hypothetical protein